jgi:hypothetical protein
MLSWAVIVLILLVFGYATTYLGAFNPMVIVSWIAFVPVILYVAHRTMPVLVRILAAEGYRATSCTHLSNASCAPCVACAAGWFTNSTTAWRRPLRSRT